MIIINQWHFLQVRSYYTNFIILLCSSLRMCLIRTENEGTNAHRVTQWLVVAAEEYPPGTICFFYACNTNKCTVRIYICIYSNFIVFDLCIHVSVIHIDHHQGIHCNIKSTIQNICVIITSKFWCCKIL